MTNDSGAIVNLSVSADRNYVFFSSIRSGTFHIWRMTADGTNLRQMTEGDSAEFSPECSPDGQWLLFLSLRSGKQCLWRMPINGGDARQISSKESAPGVYSPDGRLIAAGYAADEGRAGLKLAIFDSDGGDPIKVFNAAQGDLYAGLGWTDDSKSVIYDSVQNGIGNLWKQPIDGGSPQQVTNFTSDSIYSFALSPDGKRLVLSRGHATLDIVLLKDFH